MIVLTENLVLELKSTGTGEFPLIGWESLLTISNVEADSEDPLFPARNLANRSTISLQNWRSLVATVQYVTVSTPDGEDFEYVGFANHNFGSRQMDISIECLDADGVTWIEVAPAVKFPNDKPHVIRFVKGNYLGMRVKIDPTGSGIAPRCAVMHTGVLLDMDGYGLNANTVQIQFGRERTVVTGRSYSGAFLDRIVTGGTRRGQGVFRNIDKDFYREQVDRFIEASAANAFFWVPDPMGYDTEVAYAWLTNDPKPPTLGGGNFDLTLELEGIL